MQRFLAITKALADANRARVLMFLRDGELCVCQIIEMLHLAPSTVSKHMAVLHQARLVESRKEGRWVYYRLSDSADALIRGAIRWTQAALAPDGQVRADARAIRAVKRIGREKLCAKYGRS